MTGGERAAVLRLGWRTARREWKRTVLVVLLVAVPVAVAIVAATVMRAGDPPAAQRLAGRFGQADVTVATSRLGGEGRQRLVDTLAGLPAQVQVTTDRSLAFRVDEPPAGYFLEVTDTPVDHPLQQGRIDLVAGRPAAAPDELTVTSAVSARHGVGVGDELTVRPLDPRTVTGIVEYPSNMWLTEIQLTEPGFDAALAALDRHAGSVGLNDWATVRTTWRVGGLDEPTTEGLTSRLRDLALDLDGGQLPAEARPVPSAPLAPGNLEYAVAELDTMSTASASNPLNRPELVATLLAGVLLALVALVAATAYATGARRRLRELGLLTANGATPAHVRLAMLGEAATAGLLGAAFGLAAALAFLAFGDGLLQRLQEPRIDVSVVSIGDVIGPAALAIAAAMAAAWRPATTAAKVPPTVALQGRMPLAAPRRWVAPVGLGTTAIGSLLAAAGLASNNGGAGIDDRLANAAMIIGVLGTIGGAALLTGPIVAALGRRADRLPATLRLVVRDAARQRTRAAAASSAAMALLLLPVLAAVNLATMTQIEQTRGLHENPRHLLVSPARPADDFTMQDDFQLEHELPAGTIRMMAEQLPPGTVAAQLTRLESGGDHAAWIATSDGQPRYLLDGVDTLSSMQVDHTIRGPHDWAKMSAAVLTDQVGRAVGLPADLDVDVVVLGTARRNIHVRLPGGAIVPGQELPAHAPRNGQMPRVLVTPEVADHAGLAPAGSQALFLSPDPIGTDRGVTFTLPEGPENQVVLSWNPAPGLTWPQNMLIALGASAVVVLVILGLVMARSATESDHDLGVMVAMGAAPSLRRRFLGLQAGLYALVGALLATPIALGLTWLGMSDILNGAIGPLGVVQPGDIAIPTWPVATIVIGLPLAVTAAITLTMRSARVQPPRRIA